jgi:Tfp pilus assembly protein PilZ
MNKRKKPEKRRYKKRLAVSSKVKVSRLGDTHRGTLNAYILETKDMTQKGLFLRTKDILPIKTRLRLELSLWSGKPPVKLEGYVAWIAKESQVGYYPGMGIAISKIRRGDTKRIKEFLKKKLLNYRHALKLKKMYLQLKVMAATLYDMGQIHSHAGHFKDVIDKAVAEIDHIAHILDREVWEVKSL